MKPFKEVIVQPINQACQLFWEYSSDFEYWKYNLKILKAESENGPFKEIVSTEEADLIEFVDVDIALHKFAFNFYKFKFINKFDSSDIIEDGPYSRFTNPNLIAKVIGEDIARYLKLTGERIIVYKLKHHGELCPSFDPITRIPKYSDCSVCFDTGYIGGYYYPIYTYAQFDVDHRMLQSLGYTETAIENKTLLLPNFPVLTPGDVIIRRDNSRYTVIAVNSTHIHQSQILQVTQVAEVQSKNILYQLPVNWEDKLSYSALFKGYVSDITPFVLSSKID